MEISTSSPNTSTASPASAAYFNFTCRPRSHHHPIKSLCRTFDQPHNTAYASCSTPPEQPLSPPPHSQQTHRSHPHLYRKDLFHRPLPPPQNHPPRLYDRLYKEAIAQGYDDIFFLNERNELTEGAISNIFLRKGSQLLTPPLTCGVLPGIYRRHILETNPNAEEKVLTLEDLHAADTIYICNSVRGMNEVKLPHARSQPPLANAQAKAKPLLEPHSNPHT